MTFYFTGTFRSLRNRNYRLWAAGALISNIGTWMQRVAQDWLVLTILTDRNATAVGIVTGLQFAPQILLLPLTGYVVDHADRRKVILATQGTMAALALGLGILTIAGWVQLWHVYVFAFLLGCATAFDAPARQVFVSDLVGDTDLTNAVALNSTSFNSARMIGPALSGGLIAAVGTGASFLINAAATLAVLCSLGFLRTGEMHRDHSVHPRGGLADGVRYVMGRPDIQVILTMLFLFGTFGLNFPIFISAMSVKVFHVGPGRFGLLTSAMAAGSVIGAVLAARREKPKIAFLVGGAALFGSGLGLAAVMPDYRLFGIVLVVVGMSAQTLTTSANGLVQLSTDRHMRGRVMALLLAITLGGMAAGGPFLGWVADRFGARWTLGVGALAGLIAAGIGLRHMLRERVREEEIRAAGA
jgi:MFS family permease